MVIKTYHPYHRYSAVNIVQVVMQVDVVNVMMRMDVNSYYYFLHVVALADVDIVVVVGS
eukprot:UN10107